MFSDVPINYFSCTHRAIEPSKTIDKYEKKSKIAGITRITEITHLDRIGIPVFSAIRPTAEEGGVSVYAGKGATKNQAKASALMESFERYSSERKKEDIANPTLKTANFKEMIENCHEIDDLKIINPNELIVSNEVKNLDIKSIPLEWEIVTDIPSEKKYYIPSNAIYHPYIPKKINNNNNNIDPIAIFKGNTNGLASGNVLEEAVLHGMLEVIERDAWSIFELTKNNKKQINLESIENPLINKILNQFKTANINIKLMDLRADINIPTILASADDTQVKDPALLTIGVGTHLNPEIAILRALTEVAQSRATQIHGTREDTSRAILMRKAGYERMKKINAYYFKNEDFEDRIDIEKISDKSTKSLKKDIDIVISELKENSLDKIFMKDFTRDELGVNVVRIIIPGTENYAVDPDRIGKRWMKFQK